MTCSERARNDNVGSEASVDQQGESSEGIGSGEMAKGKEGVRTAELWRGLKKLPESMRGVYRLSAKRGERRAERLDGGAEMEAKERDLSYVLRMVAAEKLNLVKE